MQSPKTDQEQVSTLASISSDLLPLEGSRVKSEFKHRPAPLHESAPPSRAAERKHYSRPLLNTYGDLRGLTLGGSPGVGESGMPFNFQPLGGTEGS